jgi:isoleucyl-tRNA synthetase
MGAARRLVAAGRSARTEARVKVRQPLPRALLLHPGAALGGDVRREIMAELNVKALEDIDTLSGLMSWKALPNFRVLGPRLGPRINEVKAALADADGSALRRRLDADGWVEVAGERLGPDDLELRAERHEAFALAEDDGWAVALDLEVDEALRAEGMARELVRGLNDLRKAIGLAIADRVRIQLDGSDAVRHAAATHREWIAGEVLATTFELTRPSGEAHELEIDGQPVRVAVSPA